MKIGIFFGGQSREREISFAGGRTVFENLDRALFTPIPIFCDSIGNFIQLDPKYLYETNIRAFYPPKDKKKQPEVFQTYIESLGELSEIELLRLIERTGEHILPQDFKKIFDIAFIALHGPQGEDGALQGLFEWYNVPYSGCGVFGSAAGIDKVSQNKLIALSTKQKKKNTSFTKNQWLTGNKKQLLASLVETIGLPMVLKAPHQGSSIGVAFLKENNLQKFVQVVHQCFFIQEISKTDWTEKSKIEKTEWLQGQVNVSEGVGMPVVFTAGAIPNGNTDDIIFYHPQGLMDKLDDYFSYSDKSAFLTSPNAEEEILCEEFIAGKEFSCGVIQDENGQAIALPPTGIVKVSEVFDFKSKYLTGTTRKELPMVAELKRLRTIQKNCCAVFESLQFSVCARIDGFLTPTGEILLHDPNTVPGMSPTSLIFKQFAEIGLNPTQAITYMIRASLQERLKTGKNTYLLRKLLAELDRKINQRQAHKRKEVAIIFGNQPDANLSAIRAEYSRLAASEDEKPLLVFDEGDEMYEVPINVLSRENIDDIRATLHNPKPKILWETIAKTKNITAKYASDFLTQAQKITEEEIKKRSKQPAFRF